MALEVEEALLRTPIPPQTPLNWEDAADAEAEMDMSSETPSPVRQRDFETPRFLDPEALGDASVFEQVASPSSPRDEDLAITSVSLEMNEMSSSVVQPQKDERLISLDVPQPTSDTDTDRNDLRKMLEEKCTELEAMSNQCEMLRKKCIEECGPKYETLMKQYIDECTQRNKCAEETRNKCAEECGPKYEVLMKKYTDECTERKRLYNELVEMKGNIRVFCRCRPLSSEEVSKCSSNTLDLDALQDMELQIICSDNSKKQFKFDHVFGPQASQEAVFAETLPVITSVLDGFNACIFAYGQTGTGKTFTMEGTEDNRGVNYRTLEELFRIANVRNSTMRYDFFVSMLEVYNEKIRDLLADGPNQHAKKLEIKQAAEGTQEVPGLIEAQAYNTNDVWELLRTGRQNRSVGSTNANELSSRSHCLLRVTIRGENFLNGQRSKSHLWLVDLAGSERVGKIEVEGERLKESQFINKSLSALGDVISALASKNPHIPYRNSKLTHLLQSSLGGDCKTLMLVQISPSSADLGETLCSLNFATRVRGIEHGPARKQPDPAESFKYKQMAEKLRQEEKENAKLNENLQLMHLKYASRENVFKTLQEKIRDLETQLADERRARHQQETRDATKSQRPPLPSIKERPPLRRITNNIPSGLRRNSITTLPSSVHDKENFSSMRKPSNGGCPRPPMKAQRILVAQPVARPSGAQPRRRVSIAAFSSESFSACPSETRNTQQNCSNNHASLMRMPRRRSIMSFSSLPMTPLAASTPAGHEKTRSFVAGSSSNSKYFSPQAQKQQQQRWVSKIPTLVSPRQRLRLLSTPGVSGQGEGSKNSTPSKVCFSVKKRVVIGSPAPQRPLALELTAMNQVLNGKDIVEKFGGARRILCKNSKNSKNRRVSVV